MDKNYKIKDVDANTVLSDDIIDNLPVSDLFKISIGQAKHSSLSQIKDQYNSAKQDIQDRFEDKVLKIRQGDDLLLAL